MNNINNSNIRVLNSTMICFPINGIESNHRKNRSNTQKLQYSFDKLDLNNSDTSDLVEITFKSKPKNSKK
jgi:hypothetical protein